MDKFNFQFNWECGVFKRKAAAIPVSEASLLLKSGAAIVDPLEDPRYPRRGWHRFFRNISRFLWVIFVVYFSSICFNLAALFSDKGSDAPLNITEVARVLLLSWLLSLSKGDFSVAVLVLFLLVSVAVAMAWLGRWASTDAERERDILSERRLYWKILQQVRKQDKQQS